MALKFRARDYRLEEEKARSCLPTRAPAQVHPLASTSSSTRSSSEGTGAEPFHKVDPDLYQNAAVNDPLGVQGDQRGQADDPLRLDILTETSDDVDNDFNTKQSDELIQHSSKEWTIFTKALAQKFSHSSLANASAASDILPRNPKENERFTGIMNLEGMDNPEEDREDQKKELTKQDYISKLKELKSEICRAWSNEDRNTSLKLSVRVAKVLSDTSISQFYPAIFVLVTEILDMLGELVWDRIKRKSECTDDGKYIQALPDNFVPGDISFDAKELCYNWFSKIGSIREILPRIYLELAILQCWRFLKEHPLSELHRLTMMMRGLSDPMASAYCHLYMIHRVPGLDDGDIGYLVTSIDDINTALRRIVMGKDPNGSHPGVNKRLLITLLEPALQWIMKAVFRAEKQDILIRFGLLKSTSQLNEVVSFLSIVLHYLLKELPGDIVLKNALELLELIERSGDISFEQHLNFRLLGLRLNESQLSINHTSTILHKILPIVARYDGLGEYLDVLEAYLDIILQNTAGSSVSFVLEGILKRVESQRLTETGMDSLLSILLKIIDKFSALEDVLAQKKIIQCFDLLNGDPRITASSRILSKATRNISIDDPKTIQFLFEVSRALHDAVSVSSLKDIKFAISRLICCFVQKVAFCDGIETNLQFLVECRLAFRNINELKVYFVHSSNALAMTAIKNVVKSPGFVKACIAFSEVSIPSVLARCQRLNLYLETAEVALSGGFISHVEGLIAAAINCIESKNLDQGANDPDDADWFLSSLFKLCSISIMVPCINVEGASQKAQTLLSAVDSQPWSTLATRVEIRRAIIFLLTTLMQEELPYRSSNSEVVGNDVLFFGVESYKQDLALTLNLVAEELVETIEKGTGTTDVVQGKLALDVCNCLAISFQAGEGLSLMCSRMMNVARSCLHPHDKYMQSTITLLGHSNS